MTCSIIPFLKSYNNHANSCLRGGRHGTYLTSFRKLLYYPSVVFPKLILPNTSGFRTSEVPREPSPDLFNILSAGQSTASNTPSAKYTNNNAETFFVAQSDTARASDHLKNHLNDQKIRRPTINATALYIEHWHIKRARFGIFLNYRCCHRHLYNSSGPTDPVVGTSMK